MEHTITETIAGIDIVNLQLALAQGAPLSSTPLSAIPSDPFRPPNSHSVQIRVTAENLDADWSLSVGKISTFQFPCSNGIRIDTHLVSGYPVVVSPDFDSLIAKVIITAPTWDATVAKAKRALEDTAIEGVKTNLEILRGIIAHPDFAARKCDTRWLEANQNILLRTGKEISNAQPASALEMSIPSTSSTPVAVASNIIFRKGDAWSIKLSPPGASKPAFDAPSAHFLFRKVLRNEFPSALAAEIEYTPAQTGATKPATQPYTLHVQSTSASAGSITATHRRGTPGDPSHIVIPFSGKLVEVLVAQGDVLRKGDVVCVIQQMKMELEVRCSRAGRITWVMEAEDGEEIGDGTLAAEMKVEGEKDPEVVSKL